MNIELVELVARAICESEKMNPDDPLGGWIHWQEAAKAAIRAVDDYDGVFRHETGRTA